MNQKRAQITIFLIVIVVILILTLLLNILNKKEVEDTITGDILPIKQFINLCFDNSLKRAAYKVALKGGFFSTPDYSLSYWKNGMEGYIVIPYYYYQNINLTPSISDISGELEKAFANETNSCLNFSMFPDYSINELEKPKLKPNVMNESIIADVDYPIEILNRASEIRTRLMKFASKIEIPFGRYYTISNEITKEQLKNGNRVCMTCFNKYYNDTKIKMSIYTSESSAIIIYDLINGKNGEPFEFMFAHRFEFMTENYVKLYPIDELVARVGEEFSYTVKADGDDIIFYDDTDLFDVGIQNGKINFIPKKDDKGDYIITVTTLQKDKFDQETFLMRIME